MLHKHHKTPKYRGGTDDPENIVELTVEEHALAHKTLWEEDGNWQDWLAWQGLTKRIDCEDMCREASRLANTGKKVSEETKSKIAATKTGKTHTKQHIENNRKAQTGKVLADSHIKKISNSLSNRKLSDVHKTNIGVKMKGRVMNEEWRAKLAESAKRRWARKLLDD